MKNAAVKLIVLDSKFDHENVGESTGVDMHAHEVASHEIVLPTDQDDQNGSDKLADRVLELGKLKVDQVKESTKLAAGDVPNK